MRSEQPHFGVLLLRTLWWLHRRFTGHVRQCQSCRPYREQPCTVPAPAKVPQTGPSEGQQWGRGWCRGQDALHGEHPVPQCCLCYIRAHVPEWPRGRGLHCYLPKRHYDSGSRHQGHVRGPRHSHGQQSQHRFSGAASSRWPSVL